MAVFYVATQLHSHPTCSVSVTVELLYSDYLIVRFPFSSYWGITVTDGYTNQIRFLVQDLHIVYHSSF